MPNLEVTIPGEPQGQGSKTAYVIAGRAVLTEANKKLMPWRKQAIPIVQQAAQNWVVPERDTPLTLTVEFHFLKPKTVKRIHHTIKFDLDHLIRAVGDLLTQSGAILDDSQITTINATKLYGEPKTIITLTH
jgi:Holliday junction resolvase RusA-like endonuclease